MDKNGLKILACLLWAKKKGLPSTFISLIFLQTLMIVLIMHAAMVDRVKMVLTDIPVIAREDILEITVKQVNYRLSLN